MYGRRTTETNLVNGRLQKRMGRLRRAQECRVFIQGHHEEYIDWQTFEENRRTIHGNCMNSGSDESISAIREGQGLLGGLLRCGRCGRRLQVRYWGSRGSAVRYLCKGDYDAGGK